jgi:hypothetical protein
VLSSGSLSASGTLGIKKIGMEKAPLAWRIRNGIRRKYWTGYLYNEAAKAYSKFTGVPTLTAELSAVLIKRDGRRVNYGVLGYRSITTAFVNFVVDQLQTETSVFGDFKYHDSGVGTTAENVTDTAMETTDGESRSTGSQTETSANIYRSVGTISYTTTKAITEHGLFNDATTGTLMDRTVFSAVNVINGDSIAFTYSITLSSGG